MVKIHKTGQPSIKLNVANHSRGTGKKNGQREREREKREGVAHLLTAVVCPIRRYRMVVQCQKWLRNKSGVVVFVVFLSFLLLL